MGNEPSKTREEIMKEQKQEIRTAVRAANRQKMKLQIQEKKLVNDMRALAKKNQVGPAKILAKQLIITRKNIEKCETMAAQIGSLETQMAINSVQGQLVNSLEGITNIMKQSGANIDPERIASVSMNYQTESQRSTVMQEMMEDALDSVADDNVEEEADEETQKVLKEIGIEIGAGMASAHSGPIKQANSSANAAPVDVSQEAAMLSKL
ncbi:hypothetical protein WA158_007218 [Blastocystis sp. Blastoise]